MKTWDLTLRPYLEPTHLLAGGEGLQLDQLRRGPAADGAPLEQRLDHLLRPRRALLPQRRVSEICARRCPDQLRFYRV